MVLRFMDKPLKGYEAEELKRQVRQIYMGVPESLAATVVDDSPQRLGVEPDPSSSSPGTIPEPLHPYMRIVFDTDGVLFSDLIETSPTVHKAQILSQLKQSTRSHSVLGFVARELEMFLLMQRISVEVVNIVHKRQDRSEHPGYPREILVLGNLTREMAFLPVVRTCRKRAILWFMGAFFISVLACVVGTIVATRLDIGLGIGSALMAALTALQSVLLLTS